MDQQPTEPAYKVREIAVMLNVDDATVYRWIEKGLLTAHRFGNSIRVDARDFEAFKRRSRIKPVRTLTSAEAVA